MATPIPIALNKATSLESASSTTSTAQFKLSNPCQFKMWCEFDLGATSPTPYFYKNHTKNVLCSKMDVWIEQRKILFFSTMITLGWKDLSTPHDTMLV